MKATIDIVIPILNEEATLKENVEIIVSFLEKELASDYICKLVLADNGSKDETPVIAKMLANKFSGIVSYLRVERKGVGIALKTSWLASNADIVGYMDLDMATDLNHLAQAFEAIAHNGSDMVYGSRLHKNSVVVGRSPKREIISRIFNFIIKKYLKIHFSDGMCGFKFLKQQYIRAIIERGAVSDGWFFCTEILVVAEWMGLKLHELPVKWTDDPNSKVKVGALAKEYLYAMRRLKKCNSIK